MLSFQNLTSLDKLEGSDHSDKHDPGIMKSSVDPCFEEIKENLNEEQEVEIVNTDVIIIISAMLPFSVRKDEAGKFVLQKTNSLLYATIYERDFEQKHNEWWIGLGGYYPKDQQETQEIIELFRTKRCIPVI